MRKSYRSATQSLTGLRTSHARLQSRMTDVTADVKHGSRTHDPYPTSTTRSRLPHRANTVAGHNPLNEYDLSLCRQKRFTTGSRLALRGHAVSSHAGTMARLRPSGFSCFPDQAEAPSILPKDLHARLGFHLAFLILS